MQIVIDIPEVEYNKIEPFLNGETIKGGFNLFRALEIIKNGTILPKGCDIQRIIPKRVDIQKWIYTKCPNPNCNYILSTHHSDGYYSIEHKPDFCSNCGQALLWESEVKHEKEI